MAVLSRMKRRTLFAAGIGMLAAPKATLVGLGGTVASGITAIHRVTCRATWSFTSNLIGGPLRRG
jgi:hypothetical protein